MIIFHRSESLRMKGAGPFCLSRAVEKTMTIEQLRFFATIEQVNSFSEAADLLYVSQSTISKQIKALEEELGFSLFQRTTRKVKITGAGKLFSAHVKRILMEYDAMQQETRGLVGKKTASIRILSIPVLAQYGLIEEFMNFSSLYPNLNLQIEERDSDIVIEELMKGNADVAIMRSFHPQLQHSKSVRIIPFIWDELCLMVNCNHPLATRKEVSLRELSKETFYFLGSHTGICNYCIAECSKVGFVPYVQQSELSRYTLQEVINIRLVVSLVARKVGESIKTSNICIIPLKEHPKLDISFAIREERMGDHLNCLIHHILGCTQRRTPAVASLT